MPMNLARERPKLPIEPQPYVEPARGYYGQRLVRKAQSDALKEDWAKRRAAVDVLLALGYAWDSDTGWIKP
jgi:hypothetical protein